MLNTPNWIIEILRSDKFVCAHCKAPFRPTDIKACGLRVSFRSDDKQVVFVEYHCSRCKKQPTLLELQNLSFEEFAESILDDDDGIDRDAGEDEGDSTEEQKERRRIVRPTSKSKITQREIDSFKKTLHQSKTYDEFLTALGMEPEEFELNREEDSKDNHENESK